MSEHGTNPSCAACHNLIDPIGWGLEKYDAIGMRREDFKLTFANMGHGGGGKRTPAKAVALPIDTNGSVVGIAESSFASPRELGAILARTPQCQRCVVKQYFRYAVGRMEAASDSAALDRIFQDFKTSNYNFKALLLSLIRTREFPGEGGMHHVASNH